MRKLYLHTFGCKVNQYEGQQLCEQARLNGYELTPRLEDADLVIVNSCTVTGEADRQCRQLLRRMLKVNRHARIVAAGCYARRADDDLRELAPRIEIVGDREKIFGEAGAFRGITEFAGHSRAFVKIQDGCDAGCSYCIVPTVRPRLWSKSAASVVEEIGELVSRGYPEIVLTGVHLGKYGHDLAGLLKTIAGMPGRFRVRLSSLEVREATPELIAIMRDNPGRICAHLHLPLQSGSNRILERMNRPYSARDFAATVAAVRAAMPEAGISTDVIAGFPGETDEDMQATIRLIDDCALSRLHVFSFSPRPGTPASDFRDRVDRATVRERSRRLRELDARLQEKFWRRFVDRRRTAVLEGTKGTVLTDNYIRLKLQGEHEPAPGSLFEVEILPAPGAPLARVCPHG